MQDFDAARLAGMLRLQQRDGIGTLRERSLHAVFKFWADADETHHEQRVGRLVADVFDGERITEIQTRGFHTLNKKLERLLPDWDVTVVYPVTRHKRLFWVQPDSGETTPPRKSPKTGKLLDAFGELRWIAERIGHPHLTVVLVMVDTDDYRLLDGWSRDGKKGSHRLERIPTAVGETCTLRTAADYARLLPETLPSPFTTADVARCGRVTRQQAGFIINTMYKIGSIQRTGKRGNAYLYEVPIEMIPAD